MSSRLLCLALLLGLAACGGGGGGGGSAGVAGNAGEQVQAGDGDSGNGAAESGTPGGSAGSGSGGTGAQTGSGTDDAGTPGADTAHGSADSVLSVQDCDYHPLADPDVTDTGPHPTAAEAARFLQQASFGGTPAGIAELETGSLRGWLVRQFAQPRTPHLPCVDVEIERLKSAGAYVGQDVFLNSFWAQAVTRPDQLRQRVAFALSQILVVSYDGALSANHRGIASYYDMLARNAFGNYRTLLDEMARHPAMGAFLTHLRNQKENPGSGRTPDENFARELMQLFTIGLYRLNMDGTLLLDGNARPLETYDNDDVAGLARVFTGFSYGGPDTGMLRFAGAVTDPDREIVPMQMYPQYHSISEKRFLGVIIPVQHAATVQSAEDDVKTALDTLFNHPNLPPFIGRQMIQRVVKSNPSPAYVQRVAMAFASGTAHGFGSGQRGDMRALIAAVLLDPEARGTAGNADGKLREPILRLAHWARAFGARSTSGSWKVSNTDNTPNSLAQSPMRAPSAFNFYRPGYTPPNTRMAAANLVAPEFQITHETSVAGYLNFMQTSISVGVGHTVEGQRDVRANYDAEIALAHDSGALLDRIDLLLMAGGMKQRTRQTIKAALDAIVIPANNPAAADTARRQRAQLAIFLTMAAPEYLAQK